MNDELKAVIPADEAATDKNTYKLKNPVEYGGKTIDSITMRKLLARDIILVEREAHNANKNPGSLETTAYLIAPASGVDIGAINKLEGSEFIDLVKWANDFFQ